VTAPDAHHGAAAGPAAADDALAVTRAFAIPRAELEAKATRAGGPGGQHVNTSSTRIELRWNPRASRAVAALGEELRAHLLQRLAARADADGSIRVVASEHRSQRQNRDAAEARLAGLVAQALAVPKRRKATRPTRASVARRLEGKRRQSDKKRDRRGDH
jgi:ribosome-associated protein